MTSCRNSVLPLRAFLIGSLALLATACSSPVQVTRQASPNPFDATASFAIQPIEFVDLTIDDKPEADYYAASDDAEKEANWREIKANVWNEFATSLIGELRGDSVKVAVAGEGEAQFAIASTVSRVDSGYYRIPAWNAVTRIYMTVQIRDASGQVLDEIKTHDSASYDLIANPTINGRMKTVARALGDAVAGYLAERVAGD